MDEFFGFYPFGEIKVLSVVGRKPLTRDMSVTPLCQDCGVNCCATSSHQGKRYFRKYCHTCADRRYKNPEKVKEICRIGSAKRYAKFKLNKMNPCIICGFEPKAPCQMDWDHADGNRANNDPTNLKLLCSNCHRLETWENNDFDSSRYEKEGNFTGSSVITLNS